MPHEFIFEFISGISLWWYYWESLVKSGGFGKRIKRGDGHIRGFPKEEGVFKPVHYAVVHSKNWRSLHNSHQSVLYAQYFMYYQASWNKRFFPIYFNFYFFFLNVKIRFFPLFFLKFLLRNLLFIVFSQLLKHIVRVSLENISPWKVKVIWKLTLPVRCISESCSKIKINWKYLFSHFVVVSQKVLWRP